MDLVSPKEEAGMDRWMNGWPLSFIRPLSLKSEVDVQVPRWSR